MWSGRITKLTIVVVIGMGMAGICLADVAASKAPAGVTDANSAAKSVKESAEIRLLREKAEKGDAEAQYSLCAIYELGDGVGGTMQTRCR